MRAASGLLARLVTRPCALTCHLASMPPCPWAGHPQAAGLALLRSGREGRCLPAVSWEDPGVRRHRFGRR